jgi:hypothetical protein
VVLIIEDEIVGVDIVGVDIVGADVVEVARVKERLVLELVNFGLEELDDLTGRNGLEPGVLLGLELGLPLATELNVVPTLNAEEEEDTTLARASFIFKLLRQVLKPARLTRRSATALPEQVRTTDSVGSGAASVAS